MRADDSRGRHTTTHRELFPLPCGTLLLDTPGMRQLQRWADESTLADTFPDVEAFAVACRFRDCHHDAEPGCAVRAAIERGAKRSDSKTGGNFNASCAGSRASRMCGSGWSGPRAGARSPVRCDHTPR